MPLDHMFVFCDVLCAFRSQGSLRKNRLHSDYAGTTKLRVIPTMAFNSSHLTFCLANLLAFYLAFYLTFYLAHLSGILSVISSGILSGISSDILSGILSGISSGILSGKSFDILSGISSDILSGRGGPARPTAIERWQRRSGEAHCDQELAEEVLRGPLPSIAGR